MRRFVSVVVWSVLAGLIGWLVVRTFRLERGYPLVPMLAFTPYVALAAPLVAFGAAAARRWVATGVSVLVVVSFAAATVPRVVTVPEPTPTGRGLQVLTANLYYGQVPAAEVVGLVRRLGVDVLSVQELTPAAAGALADAGLGDLLPHAVLDPRSGAAGAGLYARHPLRRLPGATVPGGFAMPAALVQPPGGRAAEVTAVHPVPPATADAVPGWRRGLAALPPAGGARPRILVGDFNATLDHGALRAVMRRGYLDAAAAAGKGLAPTWPAAGWLPPVTIDHVLVDRRCAVLDVSVRAISGSDHRAVFADVLC